MAQTKRDPANLSYGALIGATVAVMFVVVITIWSELVPGLKTWLATTFTHHWVGKGVLATAMFFVTGLIAAAGRPRSDDDHAQAAGVLYWTTVVAMIALALFYLYEAVGK